MIFAFLLEIAIFSIFAETLKLFSELKMFVLMFHKPQQLKLVYLRIMLYCQKKSVKIILKRHLVLISSAGSKTENMRAHVTLPSSVTVHIGTAAHHVQYIDGTICWLNGWAKQKNRSSNIPHRMKNFRVNMLKSWIEWR